MVVTDILRRAYTHMAHDGACEWDVTNITEADKLHVSELGGCKRAPLLRIQAGGAAEKKFTPDVYDRILSGIMWGERIADIICEDFEFAAREVPVVNEMWSGKIDVLTKYPQWVIELKDTSVFNFRGGKLPYRHHVMQVMAYSRLVEEATGIAPDKSILFYHGRGKMAEFEIRDAGDDLLHLLGHVDGSGVNDTMELDIRREMTDLEDCLLVMIETGVMPEGNSSPFDGYWCCNRTQDGFTRGCPFFNVCWSVEGDVPFVGDEAFEDKLR